jgi:antitoxin MazE
MAGTRTKIIRIGNSQGVRIPRSLLEQAGLVANERSGGLGQEVELEVGQESILIRRARKARAGWAEQFERMAERGDDALLDDLPQASDWDEREWKW